MSGQDVFNGKRVYNFTPHPVKVLDDENAVLAEWPSTGSLRIKYRYDPIGWSRTIRQAYIDGIAATAPVPADADVLIVSRAMAMVNMILPGVKVFYPDEEVRDPSDGRIVIGCRWLTKAPPQLPGYGMPSTGYVVSVCS